MPAFYIASEILTGAGFNMNTGFIGSGWAEMGYLGGVECALLFFGVFAFWDVMFIKSKSYGPLAILSVYFIGRGDIILNEDLFGMLISGGAVCAPLFIMLLSTRVKPKQKARGSEPGLIANHTIESDAHVYKQKAAYCRSIASRKTYK
jgi:hypothetical protein